MNDSKVSGVTPYASEPVFRHADARLQPVVLTEAPTPTILENVSPYSLIKTAMTPKRKSRVHIEVFTGSQRRSGRKMAASKVSSGQLLPGTSVIGKTTAKKDSASSITRKATSTKACGLPTKDMAKAPSGETKAANSAESTLATGTRIKCTEGALFFTKMETATTGTG